MNDSQELKKIKKREYDKQWRLKNIEKIKQVAKEWRENNKELRISRRLKYRKNNIIKVRLSEIKSKCLRKNIDYDLDEKIIDYGYGSVLFRFKLRTEESRKTDYRKMVQSLYIQVYG